MMGAGVLSLPYVFGLVGLAFAVPGYLVVAAICCFSVWRIIQCEAILGDSRVLDPDTSTDEAMSKQDFGLGPLAQVAAHSLGLAGVVLAAFGIIVSQLGFCVAYVDIIITTLLEPNLSDKIPESVLRVGLGTDSQALLAIASEEADSWHNARLLRCAQAPAGDAFCFDTPPPPEFSVAFRLRNGRSFRVRTYSDWAPVFAQRFWQISKLNWWQNVAIYRNDYVNETTRFVSQWGLVGRPAVNDAWTKWKTSNQTAPALRSNTRGRVAFGMGAVVCQAGPDDPCQHLRPNCTAEDYCALGFTTQIFVNFANNSRLDSHGFAPFGEVEKGMDVVDDLARTLGHRYGEVQELCPPEPPETYCVYRDGQRAGVNATLFQAAEGLRRDVVLCLLSSLRKLDSLAKISVLALAVYAYLLVILPIRWGTEELTSGRAPSLGGVWGKFEPGNLGLWLGTSIFAQEAVVVSQCVYQDMRLRDHRAFRPILVSSFVICSVASTALAAFGCMCYGDSVKQVFYLNFPASSLDVTIAETILCLVLLPTFVIQLYPVARCFDELLTCAGYVSLSSDDSDETLEDSEEGRGQSCLVKVLARWLLVIITCVVAAVVPDLACISGYSGSFAMSVIGFFLPPLCHLKLHHFRVSTLDWILDVGLLAVGVTALVLGVSNTHCGAE
eukprot:s590_g26.t1